MTPEIESRIYAGVLGKCIGVYHGRPVEGWSYERIREQFGEVGYYVNADLGLPQIFPDDDISGTFGFFRALEDHGYPKDLTAQQVGQTWLNYIIEEKTILWWGGLGRSTEHTAFLRLKAGIPAPRSGSHELNGPWMPEQIGAQIFMDGFAMAAAGDPELAASLVRNAARVSHDGLAVEAAALLGAMEAAAFDEADRSRLLETGLNLVSDDRLVRIVQDLVEQTARTDDWHEVRHWIAANHGYDHYDGPCHMIPNHLIVLMAFLMGGDDFARSVTIATSAGWDTDCNAGNVGCLNGIRLGLSCFDTGTDLRSDVADRMYVVTSDGGEGITDAVRETRSIVRAARALAGEPLPEPRPRFGFDYPGATQGFAICPAAPARHAVLSVAGATGAERGLVVSLKSLSPGITGQVSTPVFVDGYAASSSFAMEASPSLYAGQTVRVAVDACPGVECRPYVLYYDLEDEVQRVCGDWSPLDGRGLAWMVPDLKGCPCYRFGLELRAEDRFDGDVVIRHIDWRGAPERFSMAGTLVQSIWNLTPFWTRAWVSSARHFAPDFKHTFCISHPEPGGIVTTGTRDWCDYAVESGLDFSLNESGGLVMRSMGHRRYMAGLIQGAEVLLVRVFDGATTILDRQVLPAAAGPLRNMKLEATGPEYALSVDGIRLCTATDDTLECGGAGFVINTGTVVAEGFTVTATGTAKGA